jgi:hypothetical protein
VAQGASKQSSLNIVNQGNDDLEIDSFIFRGHPDLELVVGTSVYPVSTESASTGIVFEEPLVVGVGQTSSMTIRYTANDANEARGELVLFSNDPSASTGTIVPIQANVGGPCITVNPSKVSFGGKLVGRASRVEVEITSCGDTALELTEIALMPDGSPEYTLSLEGMPNAPANLGQLTPADTPIVLQPNQKAKFAVVYFPEDISPLDGTGQPIKDLAVARIRSNSFRAEILTEIDGFGGREGMPDRGHRGARGRRGHPADQPPSHWLTELCGGGLDPELPVGGRPAQRFALGVPSFGHHCQPDLRSQRGWHLHLPPST